MDATAAGSRSRPPRVKVILARGAIRGPISGGDELLVTYAGHLAESGHDVSVLVLYPPAPDDPYPPRLARASVPVTCIARNDIEGTLHAGRALGDPALNAMPALAGAARRVGRSLLAGVAARYVRPCQEHLRRAEPDLVHVVGEDAGAALFIRAAHRVGIPVLYHDLGAATRPSLRRLVSSLPLCSEVATLSPGLARRLRDRVPAGVPISVLPVVSDPYEPPDAASSPDRQTPAPRPVTFGFAGRLDRPKGAHVIVDAFAAAHARNRAAVLRVAGAGPEERRVVARVKELGLDGTVQLVGFLDGPEAKAAFLQSLDVLVLPSAAEGTPYTVVEAMAHGLPVIATSVGGIPDVVTPDVGILVPPVDTAALAEAMVHLAADPGLRAGMGQAGVARHRELFSSEVVVPLLLDTYRRVARARGTATAGSA